MSEDSFKEKLAEISSKLHWRVEIRPTTYIKDRLGRNRDLREIWGETRVSLRGWDFPYLSERPEEYTFKDSCLWAKCSYEDTDEVWMLCCSGLFAGQFLARELGSWQSKLAPGRPSAGYQTIISFENQIWNITEFFEFAARLSKRGAFEEGTTIKLSLQNCSGVALGSSDYGRSIPSGLVNMNQSITIVDSYPFATIASRPYELAKDAILELFTYFGADKTPTHVIKQLQRELYGLRIGHDRIDPDVLEMDY